MPQLAWCRCGYVRYRQVATQDPFLVRGYRMTIDGSVARDEAEGAGAKPEIGSLWRRPVSSFIYPVLPIDRQVVSSGSTGCVMTESTVFDRLHRVYSHSDGLLQNRLGRRVRQVQAIEAKVSDLVLKCR